ncbi:MAG: ABC transporter permease subunit [Geminicoccaceae bacterium]|nr:ABC transporter permease subunit [Geminicoccaceae bacterium]
MATATAPAAAPALVLSRPRLIVLAALLLALALLLLRPMLPDGLVRWPAALTPDFAAWINGVFYFVQEDLGLTVVTRAVATLVEWLLDVVRNLLTGERGGFNVEPVPWLTVAALVTALGAYLGGLRLAVLGGGTFLYLALFGQWKDAMLTLSLVLVAAPAAVLLGLLLGVAAYKRAWFESLLIPLLNLFQSLPHFAYLIPVVVFFGIGQHAGAIATVMFAAPPMARMTLLGLKGLAPSVHEAALMSGCTPRQSLRHVEVPTARDALMVGVNQVIMQCLAMVVIASFIGASGLGYKLLLRLQSLKIGQAFELGVSIVLLAIVLDRFSRAYAAKKPVHADRVTFRTRWGWPLIMAGVLLLTWGLAALWPVLWEMPRHLDLGFVRLPLTLAPPIDALVDWITTDLFNALQAFRGWLLLTVLIPMREAYLALPWTAVLVLLAGLAFAAGGVRSALLVAGFVLFLALSGWWDRAMITAYMVSFADLVVIAVGLPLGLWLGQSARRAGAGLAVCDTLQTFPSFVYLIPVIMLFQVNDVSAIAAVMVYAIIPVVRYTIEGVRAVPSTLEEAALMSGANGLQRLWNVQLPLALPHIMVGINQTVMFSLFMVIIAAFIGTQDLGQEMMRALSDNDVGKGLVLGLCVAVMGLTVDEIASSWSARRRRELGIV